MAFPRPGVPWHPHPACACVRCADYSVIEWPERAHASVLDGRAGLRVNIQLLDEVRPAAGSPGGLLGVASLPRLVRVDPLQDISGCGRAVWDHAATCVAQHTDVVTMEP